MGRIVSVDAIIIQCYEVYPSIGKDNRNQDQEVGQRYIAVVSGWKY